MSAHGEIGVLVNAFEHAFLLVQPEVDEHHIRNADCRTGPIQLSPQLRILS
jgi:hypothetical protein